MFQGDMIPAAAGGRCAPPRTRLGGRSYAAPTPAMAPVRGSGRHNAPADSPTRAAGSVGATPQGIAPANRLLSPAGGALAGQAEGFCAGRKYKSQKRKLLA